MTDTTAKVRAKGLDSTGVTEDIANAMYAHKGKHYMAVVEVVVDERHEKAEGKKRVDLVIEQFEPALDDNLSEHLRELTRGLYAARAQADGQQAIDDSLTPDIDAAVKAGALHELHPFLPTDAAADNPTCEVCGRGETDSIHVSRDAFVDPFEIPQEAPVPS